MKTSFKTRVLRMGLSSFVDIDIFVMKYLFLLILHFSRISQIKIYKMLRPQKGNSKVSLNDTLLNFGLRVLKLYCTVHNVIDYISNGPNSLPGTELT